MLAIAAMKRSDTATNSATIAGRTSRVSASSARSATISAGPVVPNIIISEFGFTETVRARAVASAAACSGVTPGRSVAIALNVTIAGATGILMGRHSLVSGSGNANDGGITPTSRYGC